MKKIAIIFCLVSNLVISQIHYNVDFKNSGLSFTREFGDRGFNLDLPDSYWVYVYGEKVLLGVERFEEISDFEKVKDKLSIKYMDKMTAIMNSEASSSADSNFIYEVDHSPIFDFVRVKYYYYKETFGTNSIGNLWTSIGGGTYELIVTSGDWVVYRFYFTVSDGKLILSEEPKRLEKIEVDK
jgi:hypothetical protein